MMQMIMMKEKEEVKGDGEKMVRGRRGCNKKKLITRKVKKKTGEV